MSDDWSPLTQPHLRPVRSLLLHICFPTHNQSGSVAAKRRGVLGHPRAQGRNHGWKVEGDQGLGPNTGAHAPRPARGRAGGVCGRGSPPPAVGVRGVTPGKFVKTQMLNPAFWWLLCSLVGSRERVYPSKQQACQGLNQFQNFNFSAVVAPLVDRTKNQSNGNYETCKLHTTRHLGP